MSRLQSAHLSPLALVLLLGCPSPPGDLYWSQGQPSASEAVNSGQAGTPAPPDPNQAPPNGEANGAPGGSPPSDGSLVPGGEGGTPPSGAPATGVAPTDGRPGGPPLGDRPSDAPNLTRPEAQFETRGKMVSIKGTVEARGTLPTGTLRMDILRRGEEPGEPPELIHTQTLPEFGAFEIKAPEDIGEIKLVVFVDIGDPGPQDGEISGSTKVKVGDDPIKGVKLVIDPSVVKPETPKK
jgi:hypothetical protein